MSSSIGASLASHERFLWGLCYRMTGHKADAEDLVQETFARALARPPADLDRELRPWLVRVAMNLARDLYRRRRRRPTVGPWLPAPAYEAEVASGFEPAGTEGRYELMESVSLAFLVALERLTPNQRAVLLLRDVLEHSVEETAAALSLSAANVKTLHLRARRAMAAYDAKRSAPSSRAAVVQQRLVEMMMALASGDAAGLLALLADDAVLVSEGGGTYRAALRPIVGKEKVARFITSLAAKFPVGSASPVVANALPAIDLTLPATDPKLAPRMLLSVDVDARGAISALYVQMSPEKLDPIREPNGGGRR